MLFIVLQLSLCFGLRPSLWSFGEWTRRHNIHISYSRVPVSNTLRERRSMNIIISMIIILKLESKRCTDLASSTSFSGSNVSSAGRPGVLAVNRFQALWRHACMSSHDFINLRPGSMTFTTPSSGTMINRIKWKLHTHKESIIRLTPTKQNRMCARQ